MNLDNVEEKIKLLHDEIFQIEKTKKRLSVIKLQLDMMYSDLVAHKSNLQKEHQDLQKIEKTSTHILFSTILGNRQEQLEKERQEYLQAVMEYNSIAREIELMEYEQEVLSKKVKDTSELQKSLDYYLKVKEQRILYQNAEQAPKIKEINQELDRLQTFKREVQEARAVALVVEKVITKAFLKLKKVKNFQYTKMKGVGKQSSYAKKTYIDDALKDISEINFYLGKLDKELSDIYTQYSFFSIYKYEDFVHSFYDFLIGDWILQNKLKNAIQCLQSASDETKEILGRIDRDLNQTKKAIQKNTKSKRELVRTS
ncbi:MAG: hypothetical protein AAGA77_15720 [Bacteroidota bacterium]